MSKKQRFVRLVGYCAIATLIISVASSEAIAQKKKKRKQSILSNLALTENQKAELDHYFIEGEKHFILKEYGKAQGYFEKVLDMDPTHAVANYKMAEILVIGNKPTVALPYAIKAKVEDKSNKYYYLKLIEIYTSLGQLDLAEQAYLQMFDHTTGTESHLFDLAAIQLYQKKYEEALGSYRKAEKHYGLLEEIAYQQQQIYLKLNNLDAAIAVGERLINSNPQELSYVLSLGQVLLSNDRIEACKLLLEKRSQNFPDDDRLYVLLAEVYRKEGNITEALETLKVPFSSPSLDLNAKIRTLAGYIAMLPNPKLDEPLYELSIKMVEAHPDAYRSLAMAGDLCFNLERREEARNYYLKALEADASNYGVWQNVISIDMDLQDYKATIEHSTKALELFPNQAALYYYNGTAHLIEKNFEEAVRTFNAGKVYASKDPNLKTLFYGQLGDAYNSLGDHQKSDSAYEVALEAKPDNDHVLNNYSYFLSLRKHNLSKALKMSTQLVEANPENSTYLDTHAWVLYMMEDYKQAHKYLELAVKYDPSSTIIEHYGDVLFQLGEIEEAINQWKKARKLSSDSDMLDKKIADRQLYE